MTTKEQLISSAKEKGFRTHMYYLIERVDIEYYLWMCELQKWLREIHNIHIQLHYDANNHNWEYRMFLLKEYIYDTGYNKVVLSFNKNISYEQALEAGLLESLNLITE